MYLHRRGAVYYYRRPIPQEYQAYWLGPKGTPSKEWSISLQTKDRATAINRMDEAARVFKERLAAKVSDTRRAQVPAQRAREELMSDAEFEHYLAEMEHQRLDIVEQEERMAHDPLWEERQALAEELAEARWQRGSQQLLAEVKAEERQRAKAAGAVSVMELFEDWASTFGKPDTVSAYRAYLQHFSESVGKADAHDITEDDVTAWRNHLREKGGLSGGKISPRTINGAYMCAVKTVFGYAFRESRRLKHDPAASLPALRVKAKPKLRPSFIMDEEAAILLGDSMKPGGARLSPQRQAAKRWCQWLMAYSGARVLEVAQLRKKDVGIAKGIPYIRITPEAGRNKTECARLVPLHPHILQQGFLDLWRLRKMGRFSSIRHLAGEVGQRLKQRKSGSTFASECGSLA